MTALAIVLVSGLAILRILQFVLSVPKDDTFEE